MEALKTKVEEMCEKMATNTQVQSLIELLEAKDAKISQLEERIVLLEASNDRFERKLDDLESYGRRQNLRIVGIPPPKEGTKETAEDVSNAVKAELTKLKVANLTLIVTLFAHIVSEKRRKTSKEGKSTRLSFVLPRGARVRTCIVNGTNVEEFGATQT